MLTTTEIEDRAKQYKYTLWRKWQDLTAHEQQAAYKVLCSAMCIDVRTFKNWMYIRADDATKAISADYLFQLATFFGCKVEQMWTELPKSMYATRLQISHFLNA